MFQIGHHDAAHAVLTGTEDQIVDVMLAGRVGDAGTAAVAEFEAPPSGAFHLEEARDGLQVAIRPP